MRRDVAEQFMSLCPTCRAKYDEWVRRSKDRSDKFKNAIIRHYPQQGEEYVVIQLPGEAENGVKSPLSGRSMYFTGTHFVDLRQAVVENESLGGLYDPVDLKRPVQPSFIDWYVQYDAQGKEWLRKLAYAFTNLERCRRQGHRIGIVTWSTSYEGCLKKVLDFWNDYRSQYPLGEQQIEASMSLERYCKLNMSRNDVETPT